MHIDRGYLVPLFVFLLSASTMGKQYYYYSNQNMVQFLKKQIKKKTMVHLHHLKFNMFNL